MNTLNKFYYNNQNNIDIMLPIIKGESNISLRIIDWFVTNYSKKNNISYHIHNESDNHIEQFIVYLNYKKQLKAYSKKQFDPFCRRYRINYNYDENNSIITTVGQLNFFRWAIKNNIIDYIQENLETIENDMTLSLKKSSENKKINNKRHELSNSATKKINKHNIKITIHF